VKKIVLTLIRVWPILALCQLPFPDTLWNPFRHHFSSLSTPIPRHIRQMCKFPGRIGLIGQTKEVLPININVVFPKCSVRELRVLHWWNLISVLFGRRVISTVGPCNYIYRCIVRVLYISMLVSSSSFAKSGRLLVNKENKIRSPVIPSPRRFASNRLCDISRMLF
jgi:hypothetical protein